LYDGEFVYIHDRNATPVDSMFVDIPEDDEATPMTRQDEPASFDSIPPPLANGEYEVRKYKTKFTPDFVGGGLGYDTFYGLQGQTVLVFSDYLGNHEFIVATDVVNTIDQANVQAYYFYNRKRTSIGFGLFHTKNYYIDSDDYLFSDRFYGLQLFAARPFSTFSRLELSAGQYFIDRQFYDIGDTRTKRNSKVTTGELAYVTDNVLWGVTGPINGRRSHLSLSGGTSLFNDEGIHYYAVELDYRKYMRIAGTFTFAFRASGGASFGATPKRYFLGGTTNIIGNQTVDASVYDEENLYFADVVTPLRGYRYYELSGDRFALMNLEFRFPMIDYLIMRFPLPLAITQVQGALFYDMGSAWQGSEFKGGTSEGNSRLLDIKSGFGFGMRANLGFFLLRYDLAWATDFNKVAAHPTAYFSFGAEF